MPASNRTSRKVPQSNRINLKTGHPLISSPISNVSSQPHSSSHSASSHFTEQSGSFDRPTPINRPGARRSFADAQNFSSHGSIKFDSFDFGDSTPAKANQFDSELSSSPGRGRGPSFTEASTTTRNSSGTKSSPMNSKKLPA